MPELEVDVQVPPKQRQKHPAAPQHVSSNGNGSAAAVRPERRMERRHRGPRQVWIQGRDANGAPIEEIQIMQDYSRGGFYFVSSLHCYSVGMQLHVIPSFGSLNLEFVAEVVRVEPKRNMAYGIGVKLLHAREAVVAPRPTPA
jgi:hypothetical protein